MNLSVFLENDIYVNQHKLHVVEHNLTETKKDIEFAMTQEGELVCPICGTIYSNGLEEQLNITSDYAHCEKAYYRTEKIAYLLLQKNWKNLRRNITVSL